MKKLLLIFVLIPLLTGCQPDKREHILTMTKDCHETFWHEQRICTEFHWEEAVVIKKSGSMWFVQYVQDGFEKWFDIENDMWRPI